jgi:hypothetical protein
VKGGSKKELKFAGDCLRAEKDNKACQKKPCEKRSFVEPDFPVSHNYLFDSAHCFSALHTYRFCVPEPEQ